MIGAICAPSRASILSGRELFGATASIIPGDRGATVLNPDVATLPEVLRSHGYHTHAVGKWHNGLDAFNRSFDSGAKIFFGGMSDHRAVPVHDFDSTGRYPAEDAYRADGFSTDVFSDAVIDFLRDERDGQPFFCWAAFTAPHDPRTPPAEFAGLYDPAAIELPSNFRTTPPEMVQHDVRDEHLAALPRDPAEVRRHIADYYGMISHLDAGIGRILAYLRSSGLADDTIVIFTSDHGLAVGQHGLMGKQSLFDHSVRTPMIIAGPGIPIGGVVDDLTLHADLFATLAGLSGVAVPDSVDGHDLGPVLAGTAPGVREVVHAAYLNRERMASDGAYKLINYYEPAECVELYDLINDPGETRNIAGDPAAAVAMERLKKSLTAWQTNSGDPLGAPDLSGR